MVLGIVSFIMAHAQSTPAAQKVETNFEKRVGINTSSPQASMEIKELLEGDAPIDGRIQGLSLPNFTTAQRNKFGEGQVESMKIGTLIYNTTNKCVEMYLGYYDGAHQWSCDLTGGLGKGTGTGSTNPSNPSTGVGSNEGRSGFYVVESGFEGVFKQEQELGNSPARYVMFKLKNNSLTAHRNLDLGKAVTLENGGTISIKPGQNTNVTLQPGDDLVLKYQVQGTVKTGTLVAKFNAEPNLVAQQSREIKPIGTCRRNTKDSFSYCPYWGYQLIEQSEDECAADMDKEPYGSRKFFIDGVLQWEKEEVKPALTGRVYNAC